MAFEIKAHITIFFLRDIFQNVFGLISLFCPSQPEVEWLADLSLSATFVDCLCSKNGHFQSIILLQKPKGWRENSRQSDHLQGSRTCVVFVSKDKWPYIWSKDSHIYGARQYFLISSSNSHFVQPNGNGESKIVRSALMLKV